MTHRNFTMNPAAQNRLCVLPWITILFAICCTLLMPPSAAGQSSRDSGMVFVKGGTFMMGSDGPYAMETPRHKVTIRSFYIDKTEVTVRMYKAYCSATGMNMPPAPPWGWKDNHPIVNVTWKEAAGYAAWAGKRLPTEAEWEYAADGGSGQRDMAFSGGNNLETVAWYAGNSGKVTHVVATRAANALGMFDMTGNASEWCSDYYSGDYYKTSPSDNPAGPDAGYSQVVRGGSFRSDEDDCHVTRRRDRVPGRRGFHLGFRCAADAVSEQEEVGP